MYTSRGGGGLGNSDGASFHVNRTSTTRYDSPARTPHVPTSSAQYRESHNDKYRPRTEKHRGEYEDGDHIREMLLQEARLKFAAGDYSGKRIGYEDEVDELRKMVEGLRSELDRDRGSGTPHTKPSITQHCGTPMSMNGVERVADGSGVKVMIDLNRQHSMKQWLVPPALITGPLHPSKHTSGWPVASRASEREEYVKLQEVGGDEEVEDDEFDLEMFSEANDMKSKLEALSKFEEKLSRELDDQRSKMEEQRDKHASELRQIDQQCEPLRLGATSHTTDMQPPSTTTTANDMTSAVLSGSVDQPHVEHSHHMEGMGDWGDDVEAELASARGLFAELQTALRQPSHVAPLPSSRVTSPKTFRGGRKTHAPYGGMGFVHVSVDTSGPVLTRSVTRSAGGVPLQRGQAKARTATAKQRVGTQRNTRTAARPSHRVKKDWI